MAWTNPHTWVPGSTPGATEMNQHIRDMFNAVLPVGSLIYRVGVATAIETVVENRFLECNGVTVSRTTYVTLFNYLNGLSTPLPFGVGDGSTTFNLPDLRGRVPVAHPGSGGHADVTTLGVGEGEVLAQRSPKHRHTVRHYSFSGNAGNVGIQPTGGADVSNNGTTGTVGPDSSGRPLDAPAFLVAGIWYIKYTA